MSSTNVAQQNTASTEEKNLNNLECLVEQYENTPFLLVIADEGYFLALGNSRLTDVYKTKEKLDTFVKENTWNLIGSFVLSLINNTELIKNEN
jgi:hypothetical protein